MTGANCAVAETGTVVVCTTMQVAGKVLSNPKLYRAATETAGASIGHLPRFMLYNRLNLWGRQREVPGAPQLTFRQWYLKNRPQR